HRWVVPVQEVEVDALHAQPVEADFQILCDGLRPYPGLAIRLGVCTLGEDDHFPSDSPGLEPLADDELTLSPLVNEGGIDTISPGVPRGVQQAPPAVFFRARERHGPQHQPGARAIEAGYAAVDHGVFLLAVDRTYRRFAEAVAAPCFAFSSDTDSSHFSATLIFETLPQAR